MSAVSAAICAAPAAAACVAARTQTANAVAPIRAGHVRAARHVGAVAASRSASRRSAVTVSAAATTERAGLIAPHGGKLVNLMLPEGQKEAAIASCTKTIELSDRNACDVELLCVGGFSPLEGFMNEADYQSVVDSHRLANGMLFGLPVVLDTDSDDITVGDRVLLTYNGEKLAVFTVETKWRPNKPLEAKNCYGTTSIEHPAVQMITMERGKYYMGGKVEGLGLPTRVFPCETPAEVRSKLPQGVDVLAFQCRNPIHRAHYELFIRALDAPNVSADAVCLVHPTCGPTQDDDIPGIVRFRTYEVLAAEANNPRLRWAYLPYSMHMAGPREAIQHMIIRKNYGCSHFIIGRDMAGSKSCLTGDDFYGAYDAQEFATANAPELGMQTVPSLNITYTEEKGYVTADIAEMLEQGREQSQQEQGRLQEVEGEGPEREHPPSPPASAQQQQQGQQRRAKLPPLPPPAPPPVIPNPLPPASEVVCASTLHQLVRLPPRNISLDSEEQEGGAQVLTALELARQARIAANRAFLAGLGLGPQAMNSGQVPALAPNDPVVLAAARELAARAAEEQGRQQLEEVRRRYEAARRRRQRDEPRLLAALRELQEEERSAWQQLLQAERAAEELEWEQERLEQQASQLQAQAATQPHSPQLACDDARRDTAGP